MPVYFEKQAQIKAQVGALLFNKAPIKISVKYSDYSNVFSVENLAKLPENTKINKHAIKLKKIKKLLFGPIYSLKPIELETLKIYIKTNLASSFIRPFKFLAEAFILFDKKLNRSFRFCMDY